MYCFSSSFDKEPGEPKRVGLGYVATTKALVGSTPKFKLFLSLVTDDNGQLMSNLNRQKREEKSSVANARDSGRLSAASATAASVAVSDAKVHSQTELQMLHLDSGTVSREIKNNNVFPR